MTDQSLQPILTDLNGFWGSLSTDNRRGPATLLYNEGWLLRLVLSAEARGIRCLPRAFEPGARWFSEALLYTPFAPRTRGDQLGESVTHADGVIGHFEIGRSSRAGLHLTAAATQFIITEAKIFSGLSAGTTRARTYDQAARNVACLAHAVSRAGRPVNAYRSLGFWILAPESQIRDGVFACVNRESVEQRIRERIDAYEPDWKQQRLEPWVRDWLTPVFARLELACLPWEEVIQSVGRSDPEYGVALQEFYECCLKHNRPAGRRDVRARDADGGERV